MPPIFLASILLTFPAHEDPGEDWTRWGGPARTGVTTEGGWRVEGERLWEKEVGLGYSSVVVCGGAVYTLGFDEKEKVDRVYRLDAETGEVEWVHSYPAELMDKAHRGGSLTTPTLDGDVLYVASRKGQLFCLRAGDGEVLWSKDQRKEFDLELPTWGFAASPFVDGDRVIMNLGRVIAYDKKTGEVAWKSEDNYGDAYATPMDFEYDGEHSLAVFAGDGLAVVDIGSGKELFHKKWKTRYDINAATPLVFGNRIFISSGYGKGCSMVELEGGEARDVWSSKVMRSHMSGCVPFGDHLYGFDEDILKCIDLDGNELWRERGLDKGALAIADGKLIVLSGDGELVIAAAAPKGFEVFSRSEVLDGGVCWTPPVLSGGRIYCRNQAGVLACMDHRRNE
ncbi:MAG: alcohol dehydrogenase [Planctomycetes bacterium]|jgi:outer membrane protein assembly factor BamB|nr:alcohol dehydrogenase [Planctomycetota bacterium]